MRKIIATILLGTMCVLGTTSCAHSGCPMQISYDENNPSIEMVQVISEDLTDSQCN